MILVTGAAGKTGRAVIQALGSGAHPVRALVRRRVQEALLQQLGVQQVVVGDMSDQAVVAEAMQGIGAVYHISPNMHPDELVLGQKAIAAARAAGVERFVFHSVLHPQTEAMPHHWQKLRVEEALFTSGLVYTILQPAAYMQNVLGGWASIVERGIYPVPYAAATRLSMVDLMDVAEVAAQVLTEPGHAGATYELCGPEALSQTEVAAILARQRGHPVQVDVVSIAAWDAQARAAGLGDYQIETLVKMFQYYEQNHFWGNPAVLRWLLGREPTSFAAFVKRVRNERSQ